MNTQLSRTDGQPLSRTVSRDTNGGRRIVYLKDHPNTHENAMCSGIVCPGYCACASK